MCKQCVFDLQSVWPLTPEIDVLENYYEPDPPAELHLIDDGGDAFTLSITNEGDGPEHELLEIESNLTADPPGLNQFDLEKTKQMIEFMQQWVNRMEAK